MFLNCITHGPTNPKNKINVYLKALIDELKSLWDGVKAYDISMRQNFLMSDLCSQAHRCCNLEKISFP